MQMYMGLCKTHMYVCVCNYKWMCIHVCLSLSISLIFQTHVWIDTKITRNTIYVSKLICVQRWSVHDISISSRYPKSIGIPRWPDTHRKASSSGNPSIWGGSWWGCRAFTTCAMESLRFNHGVLGGQTTDWPQPWETVVCLLIRRFAAWDGIVSRWHGMFTRHLRPKNIMVEKTTHRIPLTANTQNPFGNDGLVKGKVPAFFNHITNCCPGNGNANL